MVQNARVPVNKGSSTALLRSEVRRIQDPRWRRFMALRIPGCQRPTVPESQSLRSMMLQEGSWSGVGRRLHQSPDSGSGTAVQWRSGEMSGNKHVGLY